MLPPTEIMESLERIESLGERAAKVMFELALVDVGRYWLEIEQIGLEITNY